MNPARHYVRFPRAASRPWSVPALCAAYQFPTGVAGPGATIGIVELGGGYRPSDITAAFARWNLPAPVLTDVGVSGGTNSPGDDADVEVVLDIQIAAAAYSYCTGGRPASGCTSPRTRTPGSWPPSARRRPTGARPISISWGGPEDSWGKAACQSFDAACADAAARGSVVFAASGDNLSDDGDGDGGQPDCDFPPPARTSSGAAGRPRRRRPRSSGTRAGAGRAAATPPTSRPSPGRSACRPGPGRMVPDVAADADPATGYEIYVNGGWTVVGGTSAVAPLYAGLFAAITSAAAQAGRPKLGNILPFLYTHPACFADITKGDNGAWRAGVGPDPCTGLGVPNGKALLDAVLGTVSPPPPAPPPPPPNPVPPPAPPQPPSPPEPVPVTQILNGVVKMPLFGDCKMTGVITPAPGPAASANLMVPGIGIPQPVLDLLDRYGKAVGMVLLADLPAVLFFKTKTWSDVLRDMMQAVGLAA
jgi:kumamolisin